MRATEAPDGQPIFVIRWRRIFFAAVALVVFSWLAGATAVWGYLRFSRGVVRASWTDTAWPGQWRQLRIAIGEHYLAEALAAVERKEFDLALHYYRTGLARAPGSAEGRLGLARLYVGYGRPDLAKQLLADNLAYFSRQTEYLRTSLDFLLQFQFDAELAQACEDLLQRDLARPERRLVTLFAATLAFHRGNYDRTEALLRREGLEDAAEGALLLARADLERGYAQLALLRLQDLIQRNLASDATYVLLAQARRQLGQLAELERNATLRLANAPLSHAPRLDFLFLHHEQRDEPALAREVSSYLQHFASDQNALLALADFAAQTGRPDLTREVQRAFAARNWPADTLTLLLAEGQIAAQRYADGLATLENAARIDPESAKRLSTVHDSLRAVALFGLNRPDEARLHLDHLLAQPNLRAENLRVVAQRLVALGRPAAARAVLLRATELDPLNQLSLTELVRLDATGRHFESLPTHARRLMAMRKPSRDVLSLAARAWSSDLNLLHPEQTKLLHELRQSTDRAGAHGG